MEEIFGEKGDFELNFVRVNAGEEYFEKLAGVEDPEKKRKIIGEQFIRIFEREAINRNSGLPCPGNHLRRCGGIRPWKGRSN